MKIAHLSDLHLGLRVFPKRERGWNLRERDLASAFHRAVQEVGRLRPGLVLITGDLFNRPDPPSTAFLTLTRGLATLRGLLPGTPVLAIAGERDTPLTPADPGPLAVLDSLPGVEAAASAPRAVHLSELGLHALLLPHRAVQRPPFPELRPDPDARWNLLLLRGRLHLRSGPVPQVEPPMLEVDPEEWDYVAVGGDHESWSRTRGVWSAGSLERTGADPWREAIQEKGFVIYDLEAGRGEFHPISVRPVVDLAPVQVDPDSPATGGRRLRELLDGVPDGVEGKILRVRLRGPISSPAGGIPPGLLRAVERRTSHVEVLVEAPELSGPALSEGEGVERMAPILSWGEGPGSRLVLSPGMVAVTAESHADRVRLLAALAALAATPEGTGSNNPVPGMGVEFKLQGGDLARLTAVRPPPASGADSPPISPSLPEEPWRGLARADWLEAAGDLEARTMEWTRERQEAETRLQSYRDRARELRERLRTLEAEGEDALCPTCGRALHEAHPELVRLLREEWEEVVQDGRWWKRRREQLEEKPADLRALERRTLEAHARMEGIRKEAREVSADTPGEDARMGGMGSTLRAKEGGPLLVRAGNLLRRASEGEIQGVVVGGPHPVLLREAGERGPPESGERGLVEGVLQLARVDEEVDGEVVLVGAFLGLEGDTRVVRLLEILEGEGLRCPVILVLSPVMVSGIPELFQGRVELHRDEGGRPRLRTVGPGGPIPIRLLPEAVYEGSDQEGESSIRRSSPT